MPQGLQLYLLTSECCLVIGTDWLELVLSSLAAVGVLVFLKPELGVRLSWPPSVDLLQAGLAGMFCRLVR